jgi:Ca-activated chloride channel family protein
MNAFQKTFCASLALASLACGVPLWADEVARDSALQINRANELLRGGDVELALAAYQAASEIAPASADLSYNTAVAQYRKGDMAAAEQLFRTAATTDDDAIAARARYNLGNCDYASALQSAEKDRPAAIKHLESAIAHYRSALAVDPHDADARANIELAARLIDQLREEQKQDEQKQQQDQQQQDQQQKQDDQSAQDKPQQGDDKPKDEKSKEEPSKNGQSSQDQAQPQPQEPNEQQDQKDAADQQQQPSPPQDQSADSKDQEANSDQQQSQPSQQKKAINPPQEQNPSPEADEPNDKQGKQPPKGELSIAGDKEEKSNDKDQQTAAAFDPTMDGEMTQQEAEKMLQAIRDRDMLRRLRRQAAERNQHVPVDRDW